MCDTNRLSTCDSSLLEIKLGHDMKFDYQECMCSEMTCLTIRNVTCLRKGTLPKIRKCFPPILYLNLMKRLSKILLILISGAWRVSGGINLLSRVKLFWQDN